MISSDGSPSVKVSSDADGYFQINSSVNTTLRFYHTDQLLDSLVVTSSEFVRISLKLKDAVGEDYTTTKLKATSARSTIGRHNFNRGIAAGPEQIFQGRVAGLQMTSSSGDPGAFTYLILRGAGSLYTNQPLFVVDGVPVNVDGYTAGNGSNNTQDRNPLRFINPSDIGKIEVLKDGTSALYGVRGGNGVILITTRNAALKRKQFEYSSRFSISSVPKRLDLLNGKEFLLAYEKTGGDPTTVDGGYDTDWQSEVFRKSFSQKHDLSFSDRYKNGSLRTSLGYEKQQGVVRNSSMERISAGLNAQHSFINNRLNLEGRIFFSHLTDEYAPIYTNSNDLIFSMIATNPTSSADPDELSSSFIPKPTAWIKYVTDGISSNIYWSKLSATYKLSEKLKLHLNTNLNGSVSERSSAYGGNPGVLSGQMNHLASIANRNATNSLVEFYTTYHTNSERSSFDAALGIVDQQFKNEYTFLNGYGFTSINPDVMVGDLRIAGDKLTGLLPSSYVNFGYDNNDFFASFLQPLSIEDYQRPSGVPVTAVSGSQKENNYGVNSYFLRMSYAYGGKYFLNGGLRRDASNRFGDENPAGYFPYASVAWKISDEDFFTNDKINLKARLSFGSAGNCNLLTNVTRRTTGYSDATISNSGQVQRPGAVSLSPNSALRWANVQQVDAGFDFSIGRKMSGSLDVYNKTTRNMLSMIPVAQPSAVEEMLVNTDGVLVNKGVELTLNFDLLRQKDISIATGLVFSYNKNRLRSWTGVLYTGAIHGEGLVGAHAQVVKEGEPLYEYFLRQFNGFDNDGFATYSNGGIQVSKGFSPIPSCNAGWTLIANFKNFYLNTLLAGQFGYYLYNNTANVLLNMASISAGRNVTTDVLNSKQSPSDDLAVSDRFLEKGNFVRLQEASLGYEFKMSGTKISALDIALIGQNLFVLTNYSGFDPEVNVSQGTSTGAGYGIDYTSYPRPRTFSIQLSVIF